MLFLFVFCCRCSCCWSYLSCVTVNHPCFPLSCSFISFWYFLIHQLMLNVRFVPLFFCHNMLFYYKIVIFFQQILWETKCKYHQRAEGYLWLWEILVKRRKGSKKVKQFSYKPQNWLCYFCQLCYLHIGWMIHRCLTKVHPTFHVSLNNYHFGQ